MPHGDQGRALVFRISYAALGCIIAFWMIFAALSGAQSNDGGIGGLVRNVPNAVPWFVLFVLWIATNRWRVAGGVAFAAVGVATIFAFNTCQSAVTFGAISLPILVSAAGVVFASWPRG